MSEVRIQRTDVKNLIQLLKQVKMKTVARFKGSLFEVHRFTKKDSEVHSSAFRVRGFSLRAIPRGLPQSVLLSPFGSTPYEP